VIQFIGRLSPATVLIILNDVGSLPVILSNAEALKSTVAVPGFLRG
jgi:hypothetical protein